jgi:CubicO group peptidase (beta-lactamase class C family)
VGKAGGSAAISIALLDDGDVAWQDAFGWAIPGRIAATPETRFNIGSVSKVLAALAAMILQDRGLIKLDTPIVEYLPTFSMLSPEYRAITTRHRARASACFPRRSASASIRCRNPCRPPGRRASARIGNPTTNRRNPWPGWSIRKRTTASANCPNWRAMHCGAAPNCSGRFPTRAPE